MTDKMDPTQLIDVSDMPIRSLVDQVGCEALARSVRRLIDGLDDPNSVISAFSSAVSP